MKLKSACVAPGVCSLTIALHILCGTIAANALAAQLKKPERPTPSDALFDPSRVIQIEIRLAPKDWHALRISHQNFGDS